MRRKHFTLVELVVVAGIVGSAMLLPALSTARERARSVNCSSNLKQICLADHMYASDNLGYRVAPANFNGEYIGNDIDAVGTRLVNRKFYGNYPAGKFILLGYLGGYGDNKAITVDNKKVFRCSSDASYDENGTQISYFDAVFAEDKPQAAARFNLSKVKTPAKLTIWFDQHVNLGHNNSNHPTMVNVAYMDGHVESKTLPSGRRFSVQSQSGDGWNILDN